MAEITVDQLDVVRRLLTAHLRTTKCACAVLNYKRFCHRCQMIYDAKRAFPEAATAALELFALTTDGERA